MTDNIDTSPDAIDRHLDPEANPSATQIPLSTLDLICALRDELDRAQSALSVAHEECCDLEGCFPLEQRANEEARHGNRGALERGVMVKPLEWFDQKMGSTGRGGDGSIYMLFIEKSGRVSCATVVLNDDFENMEAAKAAAQADYERRILSALTPSPRTDQETWEAAIEAAAQECSEWQAFTRYAKERISEEMADAIRAIPYQPPEGEG